MIEYLDSWDKQLFSLINAWNGPLGDQIMWWLSDKLIWIPLYFIILGYFFIKEGWKKGLCFLLGWALIILLADQISSGFLKPYIGRYRPCRIEAGLEIVVHTVNNKCGGRYGFVSSHSANFFAMATYFSRIFNKKILTVIFVTCAVLVAYSRVYLGVHYPGDVLGGAIIGSLSGFLGYRIFLWMQGRIINTDFEH